MVEAAAITAGFKWLASSPVVTDLLKKGNSYLGMNVNEKLQDFQNIIIPQIKMLIEAAEKSDRKDSLRGWLKSLEDAVYEAEDVLDLHEYHLLEQQALRRSKGEIAEYHLLEQQALRRSKGEIAARLAFHPLTNIKMRNCLMKVEKIAQKAKEFLPFLPVGVSNARGASETTNDSGRRVTTSLLTHEVFGRDKLRDQIVDLLHETVGLEPESSSAKSYSVVAIVGVGGAGKTTLAQYVYDYEKEAKHFDVFMWVHVSERLDVEKLTRMMVESASGRECPRLENLDTLQSEFKNLLKSKKFLLVLDDVWSMDNQQWEQLLAPLSVGNKGSKILMTTRMNGAAKALGARNILPLEELEQRDFLELFMYYALGDAKVDNNKLHEELKEIVRQSAPKLHRSPLAAKMIASQLRRWAPNVDSWKRTLSGDLSKDIMKSLLLSYQNLDPPLQRCFSYCSLFPKGDFIEREKLIHLWIAEGFIKKTDESKRIEDVGQEYFDDLVSGSFFQPTKENHSFTMHDLLYDLAEMVSKDQCLRIEENLKNEIPQEIRHLSLSITGNRDLAKKICSDLMEKICNLRNLHTFIFLSFEACYDDNISDLLHTIFVKLKRLRVVVVAEPLLVNNLPKSVGGLKHLRYLEFPHKYFTVSQESVSTLYHLEFLHLYRFRSELKRLANLINLQHLYVDEMHLEVTGVGSQARFLECFPVKKERGHELKQLGNLTRAFRGRSMHIYGLENVEEKEKALEHESEDKKGIEELQGLLNKLEKTKDIIYRNLQEEEVQLVLPPSLRELDIISCPLANSTLREGLQGLTSLTSLKIYNIVSLTSLPSAEVLRCLTMLRNLQIGRCWFLTSLGGLRALGSLKDLEIFCCPSLHAEGGSTFVLPSSLEWLEIRTCHWKHLDDLQPDDLTSSVDSESTDIPFTASLQLGHLKSLAALTIVNCPNLGPLLGLQELRHLNQLTVKKCPKLIHAKTEFGNVGLPHVKEFTTDAPSLVHLLLAEESIASLSYLRIEEFKKESFGPEEERVFQHLTSLMFLKFGSCRIKSLPNNLESLSSLKMLWIARCPNILSLPDLPRSLHWLTFRNCNPVLKKRCREPRGQDWHKIAHIRNVVIEPTHPPAFLGCFAAMCSCFLGFCAGNHISDASNNSNQANFNLRSSSPSYHHRPTPESGGHSVSEFGGDSPPTKIFGIAGSSKNLLAGLPPIVLHGSPRPLICSEPHRASSPQLEPGSTRQLEPGSEKSLTEPRSAALQPTFID